MPEVSNVGGPSPNPPPNPVVGVLREVSTRKAASDSRTNEQIIDGVIQELELPLDDAKSVAGRARAYLQSAQGNIEEAIRQAEAEVQSDNANPSPAQEVQTKSDNPSPADATKEVTDERDKGPVGKQPTQPTGEQVVQPTGKWAKRRSPILMILGALAVIGSIFSAEEGSKGKPLLAAIGGFLIGAPLLARLGNSQPWLAWLFGKEETQGNSGGTETQQPNNSATPQTETGMTNGANATQN